ncbi:MAG TPA: lysylphosphatidylglycerol synthase transmembrane domain-containing protein [Gemmatimonadaceae bacterium]
MTRTRPPIKHWLLTGLSFAAVVGVSAYMIAERWEGSLALPLRSHVFAGLAVVVEVVARSLKLSWSAKAVHIRLPFSVSVRTSLAGDFAAAITPARSGAEPTRFLVLVEAGIAAASALVVLFAEMLLEALSLAVVVVVVSIVFHNAGKVLGALVGVVGLYSGFVLGIAALALILARRNVAPAAPRWAERIGLRAGRWRVIHDWLAKVRTAIEAVRNVKLSWASAAFLASVAHVAMRLCVLPALVLPAVTEQVPLAPLALWPLGFLYGAAVVPAPGGGGAVELAFRAALGHVIPAHAFPAALLWWRFYTFYIYIALGAIIAGGVALRAVRKTEELEEELERA